MPAPARRPPQGAPAPALHRRRCAIPPWSTSPASTGCTCPRPWSLSGRRGCAVPTSAAGSGSSGCTTSPGRWSAPRPTCGGCCSRRAQDERDEGSGWLEIQVDPSGYAARFGGLTPTVELMLDAAAAASAATGVGIGVIIAANRTRHPLDARTLARLAAAHAGRGVDRLRPVQRRAAGRGGRVRPGLPDRGPRRAALGAARRRAVRPGQRPGLPRRPARGPHRPRGRGRGRPR